MKVGDLVTTDDSSQGPIGVVIELIDPNRGCRHCIRWCFVLVEGEVMPLRYGGEMKHNFRVILL